jgi:hypothetical protein
MTFHRAAAIAALSLSLSACGGGGGGGTVQTGVPNPPAPPPPAPGPSISITAPDRPSTGGVSGPGFNFTNNPPFVGLITSLPGTVMRVTPTAVGGADLGQDATATFRGTVTSGGITYPVFDLNVPSLSLTASNVRGDGTEVTLGNGGKVSAAVAALDYTLLGTWSYTAPGGGPLYLAQIATGSLTPAASLPTTGSANYTLTGGAVGAYFVPGSNSTIAAGTVRGDVNINVNFGTGFLGGSLQNMRAMPLNGTSEQWNGIILEGGINRTTGAFSGTTRTGGPLPGSGSSAFSDKARGYVLGSFYGPAHNEIGGSWTLSESTVDGGRAAYGTFAGRR